MLIDRHRLAILVELTRLGGASEAARIANRDALETVLVTMYTAASESARLTFRARMDPIAQTEKPWAAVLKTPANLTPAVITLIYGQVDDDPDAAEDGNRLPDRGTLDAAVWAPLFSAIDRWDLPAIAEFIGPLGWQLPLVRPTELDVGVPVELTPVPSPGPAPPLPPLPVPAPPPSPAPPEKFWRRPAALVVGGVGAGVLISIVARGLMRTSPRPAEVKA